MHPYHVVPYSVDRYHRIWYNYNLASRCVQRRCAPETSPLRRHRRFCLWGLGAMPMAVDFRNVATIQALSKSGGIPERLLKPWVSTNTSFRDTCVLKVGGRVLIDVDAASSWLEQFRCGDAA